MKRTFALILAAVGIGCLVAAVADDAKTTTKTGKETQMSKEQSAIVSVRYMIDTLAPPSLFTPIISALSSMWTPLPHSLR